MILVDSSVWVDAWRGRQRSLANALTAMIESGEAAINPLIYTELLQGALNARHQEEIAALLQPISVLPLPETLWTESPRNYLRLRQKGLTLTTMDCLIATHAMLEHCRIWSLDGVFAEIRALAPLQLLIP
ncbi:MAG: PIN domain-containing protein [Deltaproteobacteria bacterium]|nr:PIN domain-containing protein [Deltaproteobacteria bacterium]